MRTNRFIKRQDRDKREVDLFFMQAIAFITTDAEDYWKRSKIIF